MLPAPTHPIPHLWPVSPEGVSKFSKQALHVGIWALPSPAPAPLLDAPWPHCPPAGLAASVILTASFLALSPPENHHGCWTLLQPPLGPMILRGCPCFLWVLLLGQAVCFTGAFLGMQSPGGLQQQEQVPAHVQSHAPSQALRRGCSVASRPQSVREIPLHCLVAVLRAHHRDSYIHIYTNSVAKFKF